MPRFAILRHEMPAGSGRALHWDLMFELDAALRTWALDREPAVHLECRGEPLADHRLAYLDYEGPVSGNRGSVSRFDAGEYELQVDEAEEWRAVIHGGRLVARVTVRRGDDYSWRVSFEALPTRG